MNTPTLTGVLATIVLLSFVLAVAAARHSLN